MRHGGPAARQPRGITRRHMLYGLGLGASATLAAPYLARQAMAAQLIISENQRLAVRQQSHRLYYSPSAITGGNEGASLSIAEFFDYNCEVCRELSDGLFDLADSDRHIRLVFREFPIFGRDSQYAARAAIAAKRQGKYVPFHRAMMRSRRRVGPHNVMAIAEEVGLDATQLAADMVRPEIRASLVETSNLADMLAVPGTPTYVVDDILVGGAPRDVLAALVDVVRTNRCNTCRG